MSALPSLAVLNSLTCSQNCLLMLRVLGTSDLAFMFGLFDAATLADIRRVCSDMLASEGGDSGLSDAERAEYLELLDLIAS